MAYNNPEDRTVKEYTHMLAAVAFVPISDVETSFATLKTRVLAEMAEYVAYFDATNVTSVAARGRRRALVPRYASAG